MLCAGTTATSRWPSGRGGDHVRLRDRSHQSPRVRSREVLETLSNDRRALDYARDLVRLVGWLRGQPRGRVLLWGALGTVALIALVLVGVSGERTEALPEVGAESWTEGPRRPFEDGSRHGIRLQVHQCANPAATIPSKRLNIQSN